MATIGFLASTAIATATSIYLRYDGAISSGNDNHTLNVGVRVTWRDGRFWVLRFTEPLKKVWLQPPKVLGAHASSITACVLAPSYQFARVTSMEGTTPYWRPEFAK